MTDWTNPSVIRLLEESGQSDPIQAVTDAARSAVLDAMDRGWAGPPFDPLQLARDRRIPIVPRDDVLDARAVPHQASIRIEFNPNRPPGRVRYSVAHEIAHTLFPDCAEEVRNRARHHELQGDEWQLEALCNIGAAEILMPFGSLPHIDRETLEIEALLQLRQRYDVSMEALLIRMARLSDHPCGAFSASRIEEGRDEGRYRVEYVIASRGWTVPRLRGALLPPETVLGDCTAIGYTARATEPWGRKEASHRVEAVGVPPYPGSRFPRVVGMVMPTASEAPSDPQPSLRFVRGNATEPRGSGHRLVVQIVNDRTANWGGGGFAQAVRSVWPAVQRDFRDWVEHTPRALTLGRSRVVHLESALSVGSIVAQKGYGPSSAPRIRYSALQEGLASIAAAAQRERATVHMPRIGTGNAGGSWPIIEDLIRSTLCEAGIEVTVYDLPGSETAVGDVQEELGLS